MLTENTLRRHSEGYNFVGYLETGLTFRWGKKLKNNPKMAPWPELADISISNLCGKNCSFCYRDSTKTGNLMAFEKYTFVLDQLTSSTWGPIFQVALGGGEPSEHPEIIEILRETRDRNIIPNLTTNAENIEDKYLIAYKQYCGAVAISVCDINSEFILKKVKPFLKREIKTNLHFLLTQNSIKSAIGLLNGKWDNLLANINAIIFLTHKSMGRASTNNNLICSDELKKFLNLVDNHPSTLSFGFDACFVPLLLRYTQVDSRFIDACECGFFSVYIDESLNVKPCSFSNTPEYSFNLNECSFKDIWENKFEYYRSTVKNLCHMDCEYHPECRGGCLFHPYLNLCSSLG